MYNAMTVALFVIHYCCNNDFFIHCYQLQNLLYVIQAWFLINKNKPCFQDDILAMDYGMHIEPVHNEFKRMGTCSIPRIDYYYACPEDRPPTSRFDVTKVHYNPDDIRKKDRKEIAQVLDHFAQFSGPNLQKLVLNQEPFAQARKTDSKIVTLASIKKYFSN